jgi:D-xylose transport system permease protein
MTSGTATERRRGSSGWRRALAPRSAGVVYALIALVLVLTISSSAQGRPSYVSSVNVSNVLDQASLMGILAVSMTLVLITGNFDLSVASTAALAGTVALKLIDHHGAVFALVAALLTGALVGLINGLLVQKVGVNAFIVTLGTLTAVRGVVQAILDGQSITATDAVFQRFVTAHWLMPAGLAIGGGIVLISAGVARTVRARLREPTAGKVMLMGAGAMLLAVGAFRPLLLDETAPVWIMLGFAVVASLVLRYTVVGRNLYAVGGNPEAARLSGINIDRYKVGAFILNGLVAAGVGVLYAGKFNSVDPTVLTGVELTVIAAAVLGGTSLFGGSGYVAKSVIGTLILFTLSNGFNVLNIGANYQNVVQGGVLVAAASLYTATSTRGRGFIASALARRRKAKPQPPPATGTAAGQPSPTEPATSSQPVASVRLSK